MNVREYLIELEEELKFLPKNKRESTLIVYREKINNLIDLGEDEEKITASLPKPNEIAEGLYSSEGINYLEKKKKQSKQKANFKAIVSAFILLLLISFVVILTWFTFGSIIKISSLVFKVKGILEIVINTILVLSYIVVLLLVYIYLIDLLHMIFNMLLENVLVVFNKNPKFLDNSIMDYIDKFTKKPKLLGKILGVSALVLFVFLIVGYCTKTYFYRSFSDVKSEEVVEIIDLSKYENVDKLLIDVDSANIIINKGNEFMMKVSSEFNRKNNIQQIDSTLKFTTDTLKEFDMFGLFQEPVPYIELTIPSNIDITCLNGDGITQIDKVELNDFTLTSNLGNVILNESTFNDINILIQKGGININSSKFNNGTIESRAGNVVLENNTALNLKYINGSAKVNMNNNILNTINLTSSNGDVFINKMENIETVIETENCTLDLKQVHSAKNINIKCLYQTAVTVYESSTSYLDVIMNSGTFTGYYLTMNGKIKSTGSVMLSYITGNFDVEAYGKYCDIHEYMGESLILKTQASETTLKYIKTNYLNYNSNNSKSLLYFVFSKDMIVLDDRGDIVLDNSKSISDDLALYEKYEQPIERLNITPSAIFNVNEGVKLGAWE